MSKLVPPIASSPQVSAAMRGNKANDTSPERILRLELWKKGIRGYRKNCKNLPGKPDIIFSKLKLALFVHGCFWHQCPKCNISIPKTNTSYWEEKLRRNITRDKRVINKLEQSGWHVMRIWECEINKSLSQCVYKILNKIKDLSNDYSYLTMK